MTRMSNWRTSTRKSQALTRSQWVNTELEFPAFLWPCHPVMSRRKKIAFLGTMATKYWERGQRKVKECSIVTHQESTKHRLFLNLAIRQQFSCLKIKMSINSKACFSCSHEKKIYFPSNSILPYFHQLPFKPTKMPKVSIFQICHQGGHPSLPPSRSATSVFGPQA